MLALRGLRASPALLLVAAATLLGACADSPLPVAPTDAAPQLAKGGSTAGGRAGRIFFSSYMDGDTHVGGHELFVMNGDGTNVRRLTYSLPGSWNFHPSATADGSVVVFLSNRDGNYELYRINSDGTGEARLTNTPYDEGMPSISPDGSRIVYSAAPYGGDSELYTMNTEGTNVQLLTLNTYDEITPAFSPRGDRIAYAANINGNHDVFVMNADGSGITQLTFTASDETQPAWSPDGKKLAMVSDREIWEQVYVMNADGTSVTRVSVFPGDEMVGSPTWAPSGKQLAYFADGGPLGTFVVKPDGTGRASLKAIAFWPFWSR